mgnify:FL=1
MKKKDKNIIREEALAKLLEYSYRSDTPQIMRNDNGVFGLYFDENRNGLSEFLYRQLWHAINQVVRNDDKNWLYRYWEFADQYYSNVFVYEEKSEQAKKFMEFHIAVGGLLALNEKYEWIDHITWFTNCLPPKYFLIPSTFSEIFEWLRYFEKMVQTSLDLDVKYHLYSQYDGVRAGANLYKGIVKYLALLMFRLPKIDISVRYVNPMDIPYIYGVSKKEKKDYVSVNQKNIQIVEFLKKSVSELKFKPDSNKEQVMNLLDTYISKCKTVLSDIQCKTDEDKINYIESTLLNEFGRQSKKLITRKDSELKCFVKKSWVAEAKDLLTGYDFLEGESYNNINRESVMIYNIMSEAIFRYNMVLNSYNATSTYIVRFMDISKALNKLNIGADYTILVSNIGTHLLPPGYDNNPNVRFINTKQSEIIVLRKSLVPFVCFEADKRINDEWKLINKAENKVLCSNLWRLKEDGWVKDKAENIQQFELRVGCSVSICMPPKEKFSCIRIKATNSITQDTFDLDIIKSIQE